MKISNGGECDVSTFIPTRYQVFVCYYQREDFHQEYYWLTRPDIVLCDDAKVSKFNLSRAIFFLNRVGYGCDRAETYTMTVYECIGE